MQTPDAIATKKVAARFLLDAPDARVDRWGQLFLADKPQETNVEVAVGTVFLLDCMGSADVEQGVTEQMAKSQFKAPLKRVLKKMDGRILDLVGQAIAERDQ